MPPLPSSLPSGSPPGDRFDIEGRPAGSSNVAFLKITNRVEGTRRATEKPRSGALRWATVVLLGAGTFALLLVKTIWAVPMALLSTDPRLIGAILVGAGLITISVSSRWPTGDQSKSPRGPSFALAAVAVAALMWVYPTSAYHLEPIAFENQAASLQGTLVLPKGEGPFPAVVFMHGSGPERRGVSFHLADRFARADVAALIYDKRGTGESIGGHPRDSYRDLAADGLAAVRQLQKHPSIDPDRIGLWGASEAGWTAPLTASLAPDQVAFLVIVSGGGASPEDEALYSLRTQLENHDIPLEGIESALKLRRRINSYYRSGEGRTELLASISRIEATTWFIAANGHLPTESQVYEHGSQEWRAHMAFLDFDALPLLQEIQMPMLFIHGELDRSYPAAQSAARLHELESDQARDLRVITYPRADHNIMTRRIPWPRYPDGYIEQMVSWVKDRVGT